MSCKDCAGTGDYYDDVAKDWGKGNCHTCKGWGEPINEDKPSHVNWASEEVQCALYSCGKVFEPYLDMRKDSQGKYWCKECTNEFDAYDHQEALEKRLGM